MEIQTVKMAVPAVVHGVLHQLALEHLGREITVVPEGVSLVVVEVVHPHPAEHQLLQMGDLVEMEHHHQLADHLSLGLAEEVAEEIQAEEMAALAAGAMARGMTERETTAV